MDGSLEMPSAFPPPDPYGHRWGLVKETSDFLYQRCLDCGKRRVVVLDRDAVHRIDHTWVDTGEFSEEAD